eukprot:3254368-Rhodomonas_salina.2
MRPGSSTSSTRVLLLLVLGISGDQPEVASRSSRCLHSPGGFKFSPHSQAHQAPSPGSPSHIAASPSRRLAMWRQQSIRSTGTEPEYSCTSLSTVTRGAMDAPPRIRWSYQ